MSEKKEKGQKQKMSNDMKIFIGFIIAVVIGITILFAAMLKPKEIASVGRSKVSTDEFQYYYSQNLSYALQSKDQYTDTETFLNSSYGNSTVKETIKQQSLSQAIQTELLLMKAKEDGFKVDNKEMEDYWEDFKSTLEQNAQSYDMTIQEFSRNTFGIGYNKIEKIYKDYIKSIKYFELKSGEINVVETELSAFYENNRASIDRAEIRHILISCAEDAEESIVEEKKKLAEDILKKVNDGEDFDVLAKEYSEDPGSKDNGGMYEIQPNGQMVAEFEDWAFSHEAGDTGIVKTTYGFHVMKLESIQNTLESQKEYVTDAYRSDKYQQILNESFSSDKYKVDIKKAYESF